MADVRTLRALLVERAQELEEARAQLASLRRRYGLAAAVDADSKAKLAEAEERVAKLTREYENVQKALAEAEASDLKRRAQAEAERAKMRAQAEKELPEAANAYRRALESLAAKIEEARAVLMRIAADVLEADQAVYNAHQAVRSLARATGNEIGAEELLRAVLRDLKWTSPLPQERVEDLEYFLQLVVGRIGGPQASLSSVRRPPPPVRRAIAARIRAELLARAEERRKRREQRGNPQPAR